MSDDTIRYVGRTWEPRLLANGVDPNDYRRVVDGLETWAQWYGAWMDLGRAHEALARDAASEGRAATAGEAYYRAAIAYHFAIFSWTDNLDEYTRGHERRVACYARALPSLAPPGERVEFPLETIRIPAYLRRPHGVARPPVVLFLSGLDSAKEEHATFERFFLRRGLATLALDGPGQGETWYQMKMRVDFEVTATAAIDYLAGRDDVDGARVGVCGVSLGGYLAPRCAAFEPRLRAVASCGGLHSLEEGRLHRGLHLARWLHIWGARDPEDLAARTRGATLAGCAGRIVAPLLVVHGAQDNLIPPEDAYRTYEQARGPKQWALYPDGNHVCNNITYKYRPLVADFMAEHLR
jgi:dipeptidyl aminopeptidase/acylaminoacyl peptidase